MARQVDVYYTVQEHVSLTIPDDLDLDGEYAVLDVLALAEKVEDGEREVKESTIYIDGEEWY